MVQWLRIALQCRGQYPARSSPVGELGSHMLQNSQACVLQRLSPWATTKTQCIYLFTHITDTHPLIYANVYINTELFSFLQYIFLYLINICIYLVEFTLYLYYSV